jgi:hypothetical protein
MRIRINPAALAVLALSFTGCGESGDGLPRQPVAGKVTLDGAPLRLGLISFTPAGQPEPVASGVIQDGSYVLDRSAGPVAGPHRVSIWARETRPTGRKVRDPDSPRQTVAETRNAVPERYNLTSQLTAQVKAEGTNSFDFGLSSERVTLGMRR